MTRNSICDGILNFEVETLASLPLKCYYNFMSPIGDQITLILSWFTIFAQIAIILAAIALVLITLKHPAQILHHLSQKAAEHAMLAGFLISLAGLATSIIYSNLIGFDPCELCWWQRVFLYPQVILFGVALYNEKVRKVEDEMIFLYSLILSVCGETIALFQYYGQMFNPDILSMCTSQGFLCYFWVYHNPYDVTHCIHHSYTLLFFPSTF